MVRSQQDTHSSEGDNCFPGRWTNALRAGSVVSQPDLRPRLRTQQERDSYLGQEGSAHRNRQRGLRSATTLPGLSSADRAGSGYGGAQRSAFRRASDASPAAVCQPTPVRAQRTDLSFVSADGRDRVTALRPPPGLEAFGQSREQLSAETARKHSGAGRRVSFRQSSGSPWRPDELSNTAFSCLANSYRACPASYRSRRGPPL